MNLKETIKSYTLECGEEILTYIFVRYSFIDNNTMMCAVKPIKTVLRDFSYLLDYEVDHISEGINPFVVIVLRGMWEECV